jgi:hypothetical protein
LETYVVWVKGKLFSKYPPGFSYILSFGMNLGAPFTINPIISGLSLYFTYRLALTFVSPLYALLAILFMGTSPYFVGYSSSYFSQPLSLMLSLAGLYLLRCYDLRPQRYLLFILGMLLGLYFWVRPLDAICLNIIAIGFLFFAKKTNKIILEIGPVIITPLILIYLYMLYHSYVWDLEEISVHHNLKYDFSFNLFDFFVRIKTEMLPLFTKWYLPPTGVAIPLLSFYLINKRNIWKNVLLFHFLLIVFLYNFHASAYLEFPGWPQYGARYWYPSFGATVILAILNLNDFKLLTRKYLIPIIFIIQVPLCFYYINQYKERFNLIGKIREDIREKCPGKRVISLYKSHLPEFFNIQDFKRNPFRNGDHLFTIGPVSQQVLLSFPEHKVCTWDPSMLKN